MKITNLFPKHLVNTCFQTIFVLVVAGLSRSLFEHVGRGLQTGFSGAPSAVQQGDSWVDRALAELGAGVGLPEEFAVEGEAQSAAVHVKANPKDSVLLKPLPVWLPRGI